MRQRGRWRRGRRPGRVLAGSAQAPSAPPPAKRSGRVVLVQSLRVARLASALVSAFAVLVQSDAGGKASPPTAPVVALLRGTASFAQ
eukprot:12933069-Prorocentrum_lima.AAC.1